MRLLPEESIYFLNTWTWGYEDILKSISIAFDSKVSLFHTLDSSVLALTSHDKIHVDQYKHSIYKKISDSDLQNLASQDPDCTRFHACERFSRCHAVAVENGTTKDQYGRYSNVNVEGKTVVYVNPVVMGKQKWAEYIEEVKTLVRRGETITNLVSASSLLSSCDSLSISYPFSLSTQILF